MLFPFAVCVSVCFLNGCSLEAVERTLSSTRANIKQELVWRSPAVARQKPIVNQKPIRDNETKATTTQQLTGQKIIPQNVPLTTSESPVVSAKVPQTPTTPAPMTKPIRQDLEPIRISEKEVVLIPDAHVRSTTSPSTTASEASVTPATQVAEKRPALPFAFPANADELSKRKWQRKHQDGWTHFDTQSRQPYDTVWKTVVQRDGLVYWYDSAGDDRLYDMEPVVSTELPAELAKLQNRLRADIDNTQGKLRLIGTKAAQRTIHALEILRRDFLFDNDPEYSIHKKMLTMEKLIKTVGSAIPDLQMQIGAEKRRAADPEAPMTFVNADGTCWLNSILQMLLHMDHLTDMTASITDPQFLNAWKRIIHEKQSGEPIAFLWDLMHALGPSFKYCDGNDITYGMKQVFPLVPGLRQLVHVVSTVDCGLPETLSAQRPYLFLVPQSRSVFLKCPETRDVTIDGVTQTFGLYAVIQCQPGHAVPVVSTGKHWYELDNQRATRIPSTSVQTSETCFFGYHRIK